MMKHASRPLVMSDMDHRVRIEIRLSGYGARRTERIGFLGSESKFTVPLARPEGAVHCTAVKLACDPNNPDSEHRATPQRARELDL